MAAINVTTPAVPVNEDEWLYRKHYWITARSQVGKPVGAQFFVSRTRREQLGEISRRGWRDDNYFDLPVAEPDKEPTMEDIVALLTFKTCWMGVDNATLYRELAKIPVFARFLRKYAGRLCDYVQAPAMPRCEYREENRRALARQVTDTLGLDPEDDWWVD